MSIDITEREARSTQSAATPGVSTRGVSHDSSDARNVGSLLTQLGHDVGSLVSTEVNLAKAEISESLDDAKKGVISLVSAGLVLFAGLLILLNGLARTLASVADMEAWVSFLIVGGIVCIIGGILLANSKSRLSADNLDLKRTRKSLNKDQQVAKEQLP